MGLLIRSSTIHAAGCYTTCAIARGTRVVEYTGPVIDKEEGDRRYEGKPITYLFGIGDGTQVIDGHGTAMFINHSCDANCETEEIDGHVWITAIRDIAAGEELCYDYCLYDGDEDEAPCNCGARACRGSMFSTEELKRRKRLAQKTGKSNVANKKKSLARTDRPKKTESRGAKQGEAERKIVAREKASSTSQTRKKTSGPKKREIKPNRKTARKTR